MAVILKIFQPHFSEFFSKLNSLVKFEKEQNQPMGMIWGEGGVEILKYISQLQLILDS